MKHEASRCALHGRFLVVAHERVDPDRDGEARGSPDHVPSKVTPGGIAVAREIPQLLAGAQSERECAADQRSLTALVEPRARGRVTARGEPHGYAKMQGFVRAKPRIGF